MSDSLFDQLKARGEGFLTEISNNLMANPAFIEVLKKGIAVKEEVDKRVLEGLKAMNVATRKDLAKAGEAPRRASGRARFAEGESDAEAAGAQGLRTEGLGPAVAGKADVKAGRRAGTDPAGASFASRRSPRPGRSG